MIQGCSCPGFGTSFSTPDTNRRNSIQIIVKRVVWTSIVSHHLEVNIYQCREGLVGMGESECLVSNG